MLMQDLPVEAVVACFFCSHGHCNCLQVVWLNSTCALPLAEQSKGVTRRTLNLTGMHLNTTQDQALCLI